VFRAEIRAPTIANHESPVLVDAVVNRIELAMPKVMVEMAKGF
jgi:hypothetical protein